MRIKFKNARILTMKDNDNIFVGELVTSDNKIEYVGSCYEDTVDKTIDCEGNLLLPGFKNAHTHSPMTFLRSYADDLPLKEWLNTKIFPNEAKLTDENIYWYNKLAILEYLRNGITANFDMYIAPDVVVESSVECGFRNVQCGSLNNFTLSIDKMEECYKKYNNYHELISYKLGVHAEYTCSRELLESVAHLSNKHKAPVYLHSSETLGEVRECEDRYGCTPTVFLEKMGMYNYGGGGFHCVYLNDEDIDIYKSKKLSIVTNPASNAKLASGIAPIKRYLDEGINVAIGTDGPASNNALDMFREMYLVSVLAKLKENDAVGIKAWDVLKMATVGSAKTMGLDNCDVLETGKAADIIMLDLKQPNMQPINNISSNIVYSGNVSNVKLTMVNGKILYYNGEYNIGVEPEIVYEKCSKGDYV